MIGSSGRWLLGLALLAMGLALSIGTSTEAREGRSSDPALVTTSLLIVGVIALAFGVLAVLRAWRNSGWRYRHVVGIPIALLGALFVATSFSADCDCKETIYFGVALVVIGVVAQFSPRRP